MMGFLFPIFAVAIFSLTACSQVAPKECALPSLNEAEVIQIANEFLTQRPMNPEFRAKAEHRVVITGCRYQYEEAEKLDSFGVGIIVEIDRNRKVIDYRSSE